MSMDMMATLYVAANYEGKDIYELSEFAEDTLSPELERINGVADVSVVGSAEQSVEVIRRSKTSTTNCSEALILSSTMRRSRSMRDVPR